MAAKKPSVPVLWGKNSVPSGVMSAPGSAVFGKADRADAIRKITEAGEAGLTRRA